MSEKILYGRVIGLTNKNGYCSASNRWLGKQVGLEGGTVSNILSKLKNKGLLIIDVQKIKENKTERKIYQATTTESWNGLHPIVERAPSNRGVSIRESNRESKKIYKKKYSSISDIGEPEFEQLATDLKTTKAFIKSKYEDLKNYCEATGRRYKNYLAALRNFVKNDPKKPKLQVSTWKEEYNLPPINSNLDRIKSMKQQVGL